MTTLSLLEAQERARIVRHGTRLSVTVSRCHGVKVVQEEQGGGVPVPGSRRVYQGSTGPG